MNTGTKVVLSTVAGVAFGYILGYISRPKIEEWRLRHSEPVSEGSEPETTNDTDDDISEANTSSEEVVSDETTENTAENEDISNSKASAIEQSILPPHSADPMYVDISDSEASAIEQSILPPHSADPMYVDERSIVTVGENGSTRIGAFDFVPENAEGTYLVTSEAVSKCREMLIEQGVYDYWESEAWTYIFQEQCFYDEDDNFYRPEPTMDDVSGFLGWPGYRTMLDTIASGLNTHDEKVCYFINVDEDVMFTITIKDSNYFITDWYEECKASVIDIEAWNDEYGELYGYVDGEV